MLDGIVARCMKIGTKFGAKIDTIADILFAAAVIIKVLNVIQIPPWLIGWTICIAGIRCINIVIGIVISGHFIPEHTILNKITGVLLFAIPLCIGSFPWQQVRILIILTCAFATVAAIQEGYYIHTGRKVD